jgi:hypothetical protein
MSSEAVAKLPYATPAQPTVIGSAASAENGPFEPYGLDGGIGPDNYNSQPI